MAEQSPSQPLKNEREERFCQILALSAQNGSEKTLVQAWIESAERYPSANKNSLRVGASKCNARPRVKARLACLKQHYATQNAAPVSDESNIQTDGIRAETIQNLMEEISAQLLEFSSQASALGHRNLAMNLRSSLVKHSGRRNRAAARIETAPEAVSDGVAEEIARRVLAMGACTCQM
ncbi:hypothetical protein QTA57_08210 [Fontisubflavum oceani]|uniref:hypothetical protein n=1 Tax=Fontisubflavum oceani TaxID=2978973 RepID=UPI0025B56F37|nr:hypothetical protein [Fontisubflavum oceani]WJY23045.1 hypothetical protein QTA57_08210 [Fontisubflavum oceani]